MHKKFDPAILKCKGQIRARAAVAVINFFSFAYDCGIK